MDKKKAREVLRALVEDDPRRSQAARLREIFEEVEETLAAGVRRAAVLEALHKLGFTFTLGSFADALHRIRQERKAGAPRSPNFDKSKTALPAAPPPTSINRRRTRPPGAR